MYSEEVLHACLAIAHDCLLSRGFLVSPNNVPALFFFFCCPPTQFGSNWKGTSRGTPRSYSALKLLILMHKCFMHESEDGKRNPIYALHMKWRCLGAPTSMAKQFFSSVCHAEWKRFFFFISERHMYLWFQFIFQWTEGKVVSCIYFFGFTTQHCSPNAVGVRSR